MSRLTLVSVVAFVLLCACAPVAMKPVDHIERATVYAAQSQAEVQRARELQPTSTPKPTAKATPMPTLLPEPTWPPTSTPQPTDTPTPTPTPTRTPQATATSVPASVPPVAAVQRVIVPTVVVTVVTMRRENEPLPDAAVAAVFAMMILCFAAAIWLVFGKYYGRN